MYDNERTNSTSLLVPSQAPNEEVLDTSILRQKRQGARTYSNVSIDEPRNAPTEKYLAPTFMKEEGRSQRSKGSINSFD